MRHTRTAAVLVAVFFLASPSTSVDAQRRGGGGGRAQVNRNVTRTSVRSDQTVNRNVNVNRDIDRNVNRDVNVNRNIDVDRDIDFDRDVDVDYDRWGHPVARGVAAGVAAGVATSIALGTRVAVLPTGCTTVIVGGIGYSQCGSSWYQPYYSGTTVQYVVVGSPY
jgi:hypothetical protein